MPARSRQLRLSALDGIVSAAVPSIALLTFPHPFLRPHNPLHSLLAGFVPRYDWERLPTNCMGGPFGPHDLVRTELLLDLASDLFVFGVAMAGVASLSATLACLALSAALRPRVLIPLTLVTTILSVLAWAEFLCRGLGAM